jgi:hypothetical protein
MNKYFIYIATLPLLVYPQPAQSQLSLEDNSTPCSQAISQSVNQLKKAKAYGARTTETLGRQESRIETVDAREIGASGYPRNAPISINFKMVGVGSRNILNSPAMMKEISLKIIKDCKEVSRVIFIDECYGWYTCDPSKGFYLKNNALLPIKFYGGSADEKCSELSSAWEYEVLCD